jgi:hypothetical protein
MALNRTVEWLLGTAALTIMVWFGMILFILQFVPELPKSDDGKAALLIAAIAVLPVAGVVAGRWARRSLTEGLPREDSGQNSVLNKTGPKN